ncbi:ABC transporter permease subunit [Roseomonas sp. WA12]
MRRLAPFVLLAMLAPLLALLLDGAMAGGGESAAWALRHSLLVAAPASLAATALGSAAGIGLRAGFLGRGLAVALIALPWLLPSVIPGAALLLVAERTGYGAGRPGLLLWHVLLAAPLVAAIVWAALERVDPALFRAAAACGAKPAQAAQLLLRPRVLRAMAAGAALAFAVSIGESGSAVLLGAETLPASALPSAIGGAAALGGDTAMASLCLLVAGGALGLAALLRPLRNAA